MKSQPQQHPMTARTGPSPFSLSMINEISGADLMASELLLQYGHLLTQAEKMEILGFNRVFFVGTMQAK